jgi:hypothetical protein
MSNFAQMMCKILYSTVRTVSDWARIPIARLQLGTRIRRQVPRLWRAASRLWGLTALSATEQIELPSRQCAFVMP